MTDKAGSELSIEEFTRLCGSRAALAVAPLLEAAARHDGDARVEWSVCASPYDPSRVTDVTVDLKSMSGDRADYHLVQSADGKFYHALYVGAGGIVNSYEPIESDEDARELALSIRELLASPIVAEEWRMDGKLYKALYTFSDADWNASFGGRRPRLFGRSETSERHYEAW